MRAGGPCLHSPGEESIHPSFSHLIFNKYVLYTNFVATSRHQGHHREQTRQQSLPLMELMMQETHAQGDKHSEIFLSGWIGGWTERESSVNPCSTFCEWISIAGWSQLVGS